MQPLQQRKEIEHGIVIDGLQPYITEEILLLKFSKQNIDGITNIKVPRDFNSKQLRGYAFVGFNSSEQAIVAKKALNYFKIFDQEIRVSLITQNRNPECNLIVQNLPEAFTPKEFDDLVSTYGNIVSTKLQLKNDKVTSKGFGYVQFLDLDQANTFKQACEEQKVKVGENVITQCQFKKQDTGSLPNTNIFFKEYKQAQYTAEQIEDKEFVKAEQLKIVTYLREKLTQFGTIKSSIVSFSQIHTKPFAFVCFENQDEATAAVEAISKDEEFHFTHCNISLPKQQVLDERQRSNKYIYMKNLKAKVTQEQIQAVLKEMQLNVVSINVKKPEAYTTSYATIVLELGDKVEYLKNGLISEQHKQQSLIDLFDKNPFIGYLYTKKKHQEWLKRYHLRNFQPSSFNPMQQQYGRGTGGFPPMMGMGFPPMMPYGGVRQQGGMPPGFQQGGMLPPGMMMQKPPMMPFMMPNMGAGGPPGIQGAPGMPIMQPNFQQQQQFQQPRQHNNGQAPRMQQQQRPYNNQNQQNRRPYQNNQNQQNRRPQQNQQPQGQQQQQRKPQQPQPVGKQGTQYRPKPVQPKAVAGSVPVPQQQQAPAVAQLTIQGLEAKWEEFKKLDQNKQKQMLGTLLFPKISKVATVQGNVGKITGMLVDFTNFTVDEIRDLIKNDAEIKERVQEAEELLVQ